MAANQWREMYAQMQAMREEKTELLATLVFVRFVARQAAPTHEEATDLLRQIREESSSYANADPAEVRIGPQGGMRWRVYS